MNKLLHWNRRRVLQAGSLSALAAGLPRLGRAEDLDAWTGRPLHVALAIADTMFGRLGEGFPEPASTGFEQRLQAFLHRMDPDTRSELELVMRVVEYGPPLLAFRFRWFTGLDAEARRRYLDRWPDHRLPPLRSAATALKLLFGPIYFSDDATWQVMGYDGPWVERFQVPYFELPPVLDDPPLREVLR